MLAILCAMASCFPIGTPHCLRSFDQPRTISRQRLPMPAHVAGSVSRPVLSVMRAILRPFPSSPTKFSFGTRTLSKLMTPLARALRPMKRQRCSTFTPGQSASTMKQLIFFVFGSRAMTTKSSAMVPFVHQSFSPFST